MKYLKYSNVSKDDLIILTDKEYEACWKAWKAGEVASIKRLGVDLPRQPHLPCGTPFKLRGEDYVYLTGTKQPFIASLRSKRLFLLSGSGPCGELSDQKDVAIWRIEGDPALTYEELAEQYGLIEIDDAIERGLIKEFHVLCLFNC